MPEKSTRESDPTPARPSGPSDSQLDAAIEGARDMVESRRTTDEDEYRENAQRGKTGGPRESGYPATRTSGGRLDPEGDPHGVEPDEAIKPTALASAGSRQPFPEIQHMTMPKPISTKTHGVIDYITAGTLMALPFALGWSGRARGLALGAGIATLGTSLMTNYELGAVRLLPMRAHLSIDGAQASALMSAPKMISDGHPWRGRILAMIGAMESAVAAMTKLHSPEELADNPRLALER